MRLQSCCFFFFFSEVNYVQLIGWVFDLELQLISALKECQRVASELHETATFFLAQVDENSGAEWHGVPRKCGWFARGAQPDVKDFKITKV